MQTADIEWQDGDLPYARQFTDGYFSRDGGLAETNYVFLRHNNLPARWQTHVAPRPFVVGELGFGTGLNFLATWQAWRKQNNPPSLHYISLEKFPLSLPDLQRALEPWSELKPLADELIAAWPDAAPGVHRRLFDNGRVVLHLWFGDVLDVLRGLHADSQGLVDAWYLDGFAPSRNTEMWSPTVYQEMARLSRDDVTFSTYSAAGQVRRGLADVGFEVKKAPGFGGKREMLHGTWSPTATRPESSTPAWFQYPAVGFNKRRAVIVGAGLAGSATAYSLARRGWECIVLDRDRSSAASGNPQGAFYPPLARGFDVRTVFYLAAFSYLPHYYQQLEKDGEFGWAKCGLLKIAGSEAERAKLQAWLANLDLPSSLMHWVDAQEASALSGFELAQDGLFFPNGGWASPRDVCAAQLRASQAEVRDGVEVTSLQRQGDSWRVMDQSNQCVAEAPVVIFANAWGIKQLDLGKSLQLQVMRGQLTLPKMVDASAPLRTVLSHQGLLTPAWQGQHCLGASYELKQTETFINEADNAENFAKLAEVLPMLAASLQAGQVEARSSLRCGSNDYLPLIGPRHEEAEFAEVYATIHYRIRPPHYPEPPYLPGVYLNIAHGSYGLCSTPLCAEILAAQLNQEPYPLSRELLMRLMPQRFQVRRLLKRQ